MGEIVISNLFSGVTPEDKKTPLSEVKENLLGEYQEQKEEIKPRRKYTRRNATPVEPVPVAPVTPTPTTIDDTTKEGIKKAVGFILDFVNTRLPNPIPVESADKEFLGESAIPIIQKYLPSVSEYAMEITFVGAVGAFLYPRIQKPATEEKK